MHISTFKENEQLKNSSEKEALIPLSKKKKKAIHLRRIDKTKGFGLWVVNGEEETTCVNLPGDKGGAECPSCTCCFSNTCNAE